MKLTFFILPLLALFSTAHAADMPKCAMACAEDGFQKNQTCYEGDYHCVCSEESFVKGMAACIKKDCSVAEVAAAISASKDFCKSNGVELSDALLGAAEDVVTSKVASITSKVASVTSSLSSEMAAATSTDDAATETSAAGKGVVDGCVIAAAAGIVAWGML